MAQFSSLFSQILPLISKCDFVAAVAATKAERHARGFTSWNQLVALLFCQIGRAHSLREICDGLQTCEGKLNHLGVTGAPKRSTLAYANEHRPWQMYQFLFERTYARLSADLAHGSVQGSGKTSVARVRKRFRFKHKLYSIDASTIDLCLETFDWAHFQRAKGAIKLHLQLDHDGCLPCFAVLTDGKCGEINAVRAWKFQSGSLLVFDRGYADYGWYGQLCHDKVFFVSRIKDNALYDVLEERPLNATAKKRGVLSDEVIRLNTESGQKCPYPLRVVRLRDPETQRVFEFLTNHLKLAATTVADVYRERWQIECFFKAIKTHLKIKTFLGTTANAVWTQMWSALLAILLLKYLQLRARYGWSLSNLLAMLRFNLFTYRDLWGWLDDPWIEPPRRPNTIDPQQKRLCFH